MQSPLYLASLLFHLVTWYAPSAAFTSNRNSSSVNNHLLGSNTVLRSVGAGASAVFKDSSASGDRKMREMPALLHAAYLLGLYSEDTLSERLELYF